MKWIFTLGFLFCGLVVQAEWKSPFNTPIGVQDYRKKAESKKGSRWTLDDWLTQKERNKMMDLWLGMYTPAPYELFIGGNYQNYDLKSGGVTSPNLSSKAFQIGFYALILGLEFEYEDNFYEKSISTLSSLNLRILGNSNQGTHLNISYGIKNSKLNPQLQINQNYIEGELEIYIERNTGLHGMYRSFLPMTDSTLGLVSGRKWEAGVFVDINFIRLHAEYFSDTLTTDLNSNRQTQEKIGIQSGILFYF